MKKGSARANVRVPPVSTLPARTLATRLDQHQLASHPSRVQATSCPDLRNAATQTVRVGTPLSRPVRPDRADVATHCADVRASLIVPRLIAYGRIRRQLMSFDVRTQL